MICSRYGEKGYGGDKYSSGLEKAGGYYHVMVKTRHGRKVRIPRHILSKDCVLFHCQLCNATPMTAYRDYVRLIAKFRQQHVLYDLI